MGFIPETTCRRCGQKYSGLRNRCPNCGTPRQNQPNRVPHTTASATPNTAASRRAGADIRWQLIFGGILLVAVILAVVVLIAGGGKDSGSNSGNRPSVTNNPGSQIVYSAADLPTPSPSPIPTPEASPTPVIEQMAIAFLNNSVKNHSLTLTNAGEITIDLDLNVFPSSDDLPVTWSSSNEKILTVDDRGIVTVVGASPNITVHAVIIAECGEHHRPCGDHRRVRRSAGLCDDLRPGVSGGISHAEPVRSRNLRAGQSRVGQHHLRQALGQAGLIDADFSENNAKNS